jgi:cyanophycinase-like exopeptidase
MADLMGWHPQLLGIGLDEATAIIVRKSRADVVGRGEAHFYAGKGKPVSLKDGAAYDLKERKEIEK